MSDTKSLKIQRTRRRRRWVLIVALGLFLGLLAVGFLRFIYNPFTTGVPDTLVLIPEDMDFVLSVPELPQLARELGSRHFMTEVGAHHGFNEFLESGWVKEKGVVEAVGAALLQIHSMRNLPLGLDLFGDVSGSHVIVAGYAPERSNQKTGVAPSTAVSVSTTAASRAELASYRFMTVLKPDSWMVIAAVNILMNEKLCQWFMKDKLAAAGVEVSHLRDAVMLHVSKIDRDFFVTRIADTILVSTERDQLGRIHKFVALDGLPRSPHARYQKLLPGAERLPSDVALLVRRVPLERETAIDATLFELWGYETKSLVESTLPRFGGEDVLFRLSAGEGLTVSAAGPRGGSRAGDMFPALKPFDRERLESEVGEVLELFPSEAFGVLYLEAEAGDLMNALYDQPAIFSGSDRRVFDQFCSGIDVFKSVQGFGAALSDILEDRLSIVFFRQPREAYEDRAAAGIALVARIDNEARLREVLSGIESSVTKSTGSTGAATRINKRKSSSLEIFEPTFVSGTFDDTRVTSPALAITKGRLIITNFSPLLDELAKVESDPSRAMSKNEGLRRSLSYAPRALRAAALIDTEALFPYLEQSAPGWVTMRTRATNQLYASLRAEFPSSTAGQGLVPGNKNYEDALNRWLEQKIAARSANLRPKVKRDFDEHFRWFKNLLSGVGFFVEDSATDTALSIRCDVKP